MEMNDKTLQMMSETMGLVSMAKNLREAPPEIWDRLRGFVKESGISFTTVVNLHTNPLAEEELTERQTEHKEQHKRLAIQYVLGVIDLMEAIALETRERWEFQQISHAAICERFEEEGELQ